MGRKILVTRRIPDAGLQIIEQALGAPRVEPWGRSATEGELVEAVDGVDGLLCMLTDSITRAVLEAARGCTVVSNHAVGFDNVDVEAATQLGILVTYTPGVLTEATADLAFALILAAARRVCEGDRSVREGRFRGWEPMPAFGLELSGRTLGIVGAGRIGQAVARRGVGFGMKILYTARGPKPSFERETGAMRTDLEPLLAEADFVSLHLPLTDQTRGTIGAEQLGAMKRTAVLVNTARGPVVDEAALVQALGERRIFAAGLDVYEKEQEVHPGLAALDNVVLSPHMGSATEQTRRRMAVLAAQNLVDALQGRRPAHVVNPELLR